MTKEEVKKPRKLIDVPIAASRAGVAEKTLRKWIWEQKICYYKLSPKCVRIDELEFDEWLEKRRVKAKS
jgi:excisionase family DNA binding protein